MEKMVKISKNKMERKKIYERFFSNKKHRGIRGFRL